VPEPPVVEFQPVDSVWEPPHRPAKIRRWRVEAQPGRASREAVRYWKTVGVLDERGSVVAQWKTVVGALFPSSTDQATLKAEVRATEAEACRSRSCSGGAPR
jgi:hypothetical protein